MKVKKYDRKHRPWPLIQSLRLLVTLKLNPAEMQLISGFIDTYLRLNVRIQVR